MAAGLNKAAPPPLLDLLQTVPRLLQLLDSMSLAALASTSRNLRSLICSHVSGISIIVSSGYGTGFQVSLLQALVNGGWSNLHRLDLKFRARLEPAATAQLARADWPKLVSLDLSRNSLGAGALARLVAGDWPALASLNLSHNKLDAAALSWLVQAKWPLECLELR